MAPPPTRKPPRSARVNLSDVAAAAGVSKMTASRVLRDGAGFSEATRARVLAEVDRLGYLPNRLATVFAGDGTSTFVGVAIPDLSTEIFAQVLNGINRRLGAFGYQTVLGLTENSAETEESWIETVLSWKPAAVILTGDNRTDRAAAMLRAANLPVAEIWDLVPDPLDMNIGLDHAASGHAMGRHLTDKGYRRLAYIGTAHDSTNAARARRAGFSQAIAEAGATLVQDMAIPDVPGFYPGYYGTEQVLASARRVEAIFYQNDNMAMGGFQYCQTHGIAVPDDLGIAGWGALPVAAVLPLRLTTVRVAHLRLGQIAAEQLLHRLQGNTANRVSDIGFQLIPGQTV